MATGFDKADKNKEHATESSGSRSVLSAEADVLLGGLSDGLRRAGSRTVQDLGKAAHDFADHPLTFSVTYLKNHWQDAAAGAVIGVMSPRKLVNAALIAYSSRGIATRAYNAAVLAADPTVDTVKARAYFSSGVASEGSAFLSSLPMAMAGGMVGKAGANAVFGKGMGAGDLLTGRVGTNDVKANLWNIRDGVRPPAIKVVVSDLDNTLFDSHEVLAKGFSKAMTETAGRTGIAESRLYELMGKEMERVYTANNPGVITSKTPPIARLYMATDCPWSIELALKDELKIGQPGGMSVADFRRKIDEPFWNTIDKTVTGELKVFDTVVDTLAELKNRGLPVVGLSDASAQAAMQRLSTAGLSVGPIDRLFALSAPAEPAGLPAGLTDFGRARVADLLSRENSFKEFRILPENWEKPKPNGMQEIMSRYNVRPRQLLMIGDSQRKDLGVAHNVGAPAVWAKYGTHSPQLQAVLEKLHPAKKGAHGFTVEKTPSGDAVAEHFSDLLDHLNPKPNYVQFSKNAIKGLAVRPPLASALAHELTEPVVPEQDK